MKHYGHVDLFFDEETGRVYVVRSLFDPLDFDGPKPFSKVPGYLSYDGVDVVFTPKKKRKKKHKSKKTKRKP